MSIEQSQTQSSRYRNSGSGRRPTHKDIFVFQYTLSGRGVIECAGKQHDLPAGTGFFCNVTDAKTVYYYPDDAVEPWQFLWITISDATGCATAVNEQFGYIFDIDQSEPQIRRLLAYGDVPEKTIQVNAGAAHVFANSIIGMLVDQSQSDIRQHGSSLKVVQKALKIIDSSINQPLNAVSLARKTGVSAEHLNRIFRSELGQTPYQYICEAKVQIACELLKNTDQTIANVATQLGYGPDSHFARLFKRIVGITPSQFRKGASMPMQRSLH